MVIRRGLHDVVLQVLYGWLPATTRRIRVAWVLGVAKPAAEAVAAGGIELLSLKMPVRTFAWMWVPVLLVWFCCALRLLKSWRRIRETFDENNATGDSADGDDLPRRAGDGS